MKHLLLTLMVFMLLSCSRSDKPNITDTVIDKLYQQHNQWQGTPYQFGGMSQQGIDCSGFVALTFSEEFDIQLPRTTQAQAQLPHVVSKQKLQTGDLVFFKISNQGKLHHVGIYLENHQFLHASTSQGVTVSDLQDDYWRDNYWKAVRVLD